MLSKRRLTTSLKYARSYLAQTKEYKESKPRKVKALKGIINYTESVGLDPKLRNAIPPQYFTRKASHLISRLYLVDQSVAKSVANHVLPDLLRDEDQLVCDTNAGLGLISQELLTKDVKSVRLYEWCINFRESLNELKETFPGKVEVFNYNLYSLDTEWRETNDRMDNLLQDLPHKTWDDEPCMTIVGPMPNLHFIKYLLSSLNNSHKIFSFGRLQIFALMTPKDYSKCIATTETARNYTKFSVAFQNFFDYDLLEKYPRKSFIPWDLKINQENAESVNDEAECIYLVKMNLKRDFPVPHMNASHFITFIEYCMKGKFPVIPFLEESFPGIGVNLMVPKSNKKEAHFKNMSIFTEFRDLSPRDWQQIFMKMLLRPEFYDFVSLQTIQKKSKDKDKISEQNSVKDEEID